MSRDAVGCCQLNTTPLTGNVGSWDAPSTYDTAPGPLPQLIPKSSPGGKLSPPRGWSSAGAAGTPAPAPVTWTLRIEDHGPCTRSLLTAWTRQKYVPGA